MRLEGSCHCGAVKFQLQSLHPYPFNRCYCSICRKTAGGGGFAINLGGDFDSLEVQGAEHIGTYRATIDGEISSAQRQFCSRCASALWLYDERWPELVHPFASAIDTQLPEPPQTTHMMLDYKAGWVSLDAKEQDRCFAQYPNESLAQWHQRLDLGG